MISIKNVSKSFNDSKSFIVKNISLEIEDGEILVMLGSSGCGKTTTLKMINRLIEPTSGEILIKNKSIFDYDPVLLRRNIGYAIQQVGLFPHMTVAENISIVLRLLGKSKQEQRDRALYLLNLVNLNANQYADCMVNQLSGGQQQRVGVARALANDPDYLLMDEPFGALDSITRNNLQEELIKINKDLHKTIIFVTHDIFEALRLADRIVVMHDGNIEQVGSATELVANPANDFVNDLLQTPSQQLAELKNTFKDTDFL